MFNLSSRSFRDHLIAAELEEFTKKYLITQQTEINDFQDCHVLFRSLPHRTSYQNLLTRSRVITSRKLPIPSLQCYKPLFNDVSQDIVTLDNTMNFSDAITAIHKVATALGPKFYGALLVDNSNKIKINPLHPLTAMSFATKEHDNLIPTIWKVVIFLYKDRGLLDDHYKTKDADTDLIQENLKDLINCHSGRVASVTKNIKCEAGQRPGTITLSYKVEHHPDDAPDSEGLLVAHQLLTRGIVIPYYGTSILKMKPGSTSGLNISPMISSNISHDSTYNEGRNYDSKERGKSKSKISVAYSSVCTGSSDNTTLEGLRTLTHSNTLSPYNRNTITDGSLAYADACNAKSFEIYKIAQILKTEDENGKKQT